MLELFHFAYLHLQREEKNSGCSWWLGHSPKFRAFLFTVQCGFVLFFFRVLEILPFSVQLNYIKSVTASGKSLAKSIPLLLTIQFFLKAYGFHIVSIFCFKIVQGSIFLSRSIRKISKFTQSSSNRRIGWFGFFW